jgi:hypothetical protein
MYTWGRGGGGRGMKQGRAPQGKLKKKLLIKMAVKPKIEYPLRFCPKSLDRPRDFEKFKTFRS